MLPAEFVRVTWVAESVGFPQAQLGARVALLAPADGPCSRWPAWKRHVQFGPSTPVAGLALTGRARPIEGHHARWASRRPVSWHAMPTLRSSEMNGRSSRPSGEADWGRHTCGEEGLHTTDCSATTWLKKSRYRVATACQVNRLVAVATRSDRRAGSSSKAARSPLTMSASDLASTR